MIAITSAICGNDTPRKQAFSANLGGPDNLWAVLHSPGFLHPNALHHCTKDLYTGVTLTAFDDFDLDEGESLPQSARAAGFVSPSADDVLDLVMIMAGRHGCGLLWKIVAFGMYAAYAS